MTKQETLNNALLLAVAIERLINGKPLTRPQYRALQILMDSQLKP